jgi:C_GCAxxG_C_C family probable redox protein
MTKTNESIQLFSSGFNCAQSVLSTYAKEYFKQPGDALKLASAFGAGVTYRGEMCGAVSGALMVIGLKYGYNEGTQDSTKQNCLQISREFLT